MEVDPPPTLLTDSADCLVPAGCGVRGDHWEAGGDVNSIPDKRSKLEMPEVIDDTEVPAETLRAFDPCLF